MSATLDSHLFANYFGSCPALAAGGRTFPVEHHFLEDAHDLIGYHLDADSVAAMRPNRDAKSRRQLEASAGGRNKQGLLKVTNNSQWRVACILHALRHVSVYAVLAVLEG